jgi:protein gp37
VQALVSQPDGSRAQSQEAFSVGQNSAIEWTEATWNPLTGCDKISPGCTHCYAERMSLRLRAMGQPNYKNGFELTLHERVLVNSMSDLFHKDVPEEYVQRVFAVMRQASWHRFQVLTKRSERLRELSGKIDWPANVWMGVSVESSEYRCRVDDLRHTAARTRFLSIEPLLGPIPDLDLSNIHWAIVGGESGPGARPMQEEWVIDLRDQCLRAGVPFFFKQWGGVNKKRTGRSLEGRTWDGMPED